MYILYLSLFTSFNNTLHKIIICSMDSAPVHLLILHAFYGVFSPFSLKKSSFSPLKGRTRDNNVWSKCGDVLNA